MSKTTDTELESFKRAEALKHIKTLPSVPLKKVIEVLPDEVVANPEDFQHAIGTAQMEKVDGTGKGYVIVSEKMFNYLVRNQVTPYLTYGDPGIKVYKEGTREHLESLERMTPEQYHEYIVKNKPRV